MIIASVHCLTQCSWPDYNADAWAWHADSEWDWILMYPETHETHPCKKTRATVDRAQTWGWQQLSEWVGGPTKLVIMELSSSGFKSLSWVHSPPKKLGQISVTQVTFLCPLNSPAHSLEPAASGLGPAPELKEFWFYWNRHHLNKTNCLLLNVCSVASDQIEGLPLKISKT